MLDELDKAMRNWRALQPQPKQDDGSYMAKEIAACLNQNCWLPGSSSSGVAIIRGFLFQKVPLKDRLSPYAVSRALKAYVDRRRAFMMRARGFKRPSSALGLSTFSYSP